VRDETKPALRASDAEREQGIALLRDAVVDVDVHNVFGTVTLIVPTGISVTVDGGGMFASEIIETPDTPPLPGSPKLRIHSSGPGGTLYVRSREQKRLQLRQ